MTEPSSPHIAPSRWRHVKGVAIKVGIVVFGTAGLVLAILAPPHRVTAVATAILAIATVVLAVVAWREHYRRRT